MTKLREVMEKERDGEKWHGSVYSGGLRLGFLEIRKWCREDFGNGKEWKLN